MEKKENLGVMALILLIVVIILFIPITNSTMFFGSPNGKRLYENLTLVNGTTSNALELINFNNYVVILKVNGREIQRSQITSPIALIQINYSVEQWTVRKENERENNSLIINMKTPLSIDPMEIFSVEKIFSFYEGIWGVGTLIIIFLVPGSVYLMSRSIGATVLTLFACGLGGYLVSPSLRPIVTVIVAASIAYLIYKVFWGRE